MGQATSTQVTDIANNILNESVTNILNKSATTVNTTATNIQGASFKVGKDGDVTCTDTGGGGLINQKLVGTFKFVTEVTDSSAQELKNEFQSSMNSSSEQFQKIMTELGGILGTSIDTDSQTLISNEIQNVIETNVTNEKLTEIMNTLKITQSGDVEFNGKYTGPCAINQDLLVEMQAGTIVSNLAETVASNAVVNDIVTKTVQKQEVELKGLSNIIESIGDAISQVAMASILPLLIIGGIVLLLSMGLVIPSSTRIVGLMLFFLLIIAGGVLTFLFFSEMAPFEPEEVPPEEVIENDCEVEYEEANAIKKKYEKETDKEKKKQILLKPENKKKLEAFNVCMNSEGFRFGGKNRCGGGCDSRYDNWYLFRNSMRGM